MSASLPRSDSYRSIWRLVWPQMLMMLAHFFIGFFDVLVAARIGKEVQASVGIIVQSMMFFQIIAIATASGATAAISQSLGAGLTKRARRYVGLCLLLAAVFSVAITILIFPLRGAFLQLIQTPDSIMPVAGYFLAVYMLTLPMFYIVILANAIFRAHKWVYYPLFSTVIITVINTVGDFGLGLGYWGFPKLGYAGVAWSTFASVTAGALCSLLILRNRGLLCKACLAPWRWCRRAVPYLVKVAWPAGAMQILWQVGYLVLFAITSTLPAGHIDALAGMTAGMRVESLLFLPGLSFNMTASILVGHALGAGDTAGAKITAYKIMGFGILSIGLLGIIVWWRVDPIAALLAPDAAVQRETISYLAYNISAIPFTMGNMILGGVMVGAGATIYNMAIFGLSTWVVRLPLAYMLGHFIWKDSSGIWAAQLISTIVQCFCLWYVFQFKNWQRFTLRKIQNGAKSPHHETLIRSYR